MYIWPSKSCSRFNCQRERHRRQRLHCWLCGPPDTDKQLAGGAAGDNLAIDMNENGTVDIKDYAVLAGMWLDQILWPPPVTNVWGYEFKNDFTDANCMYLELLPEMPTTFIWNSVARYILSIQVHSLPSRVMGPAKSRYPEVR